MDFPFFRNIFTLQSSLLLYNVIEAKAFKKLNLSKEFFYNETCTFSNANA